jgi:hypothetical protein
VICFLEACFCGGGYLRCLVGQMFVFRLCLLFDGALPGAVRFCCVARSSAAGDALTGWVFEGGTQRCCWWSGCGFGSADFFVAAPAVGAPVSFTSCWLCWGVALRRRAMAAFRFFACSSCCLTVPYRLGEGEEVNYLIDNSALPTW